MDPSRDVLSRALVALVAACALLAPPSVAQTVATGQVVGGTIGGTNSVRSVGYGRIVRDLTLWCRADRGVQATYGGSVGAWLDVSKRQRHMGQENLTKAPRLVDLGGAGHPELVFDGFDVLEQEHALPTGSYTLGLVFRLADGASGGSVLGGVGYDLRLDPQTGIELEQGGAMLQSASSWSPAVPHVLLVTYNATSGMTRVFLDGTQIGAGPLATNPDPTLLLGGPAGGFRGAVSEVMVFDTVLDPQALTGVFDYLADRYLLGPQLPWVEFDELPQTAELVPRDRTTNMASFAVDGIVRETGFTTIIATAFRNGLPFDIDTQSLAYGPNGASFDLDLSIAAGTFEYELRVLLLAPGGVMSTVATRRRLVAGDVFLVGGQSNALAPDFEAELLGNANQSPWVRSFGTASEVAEESVGDRHWDRAGALDFDGHGFVGQWALRLGAELVGATGVPVAIVNGAMGGTSIALHQRSLVQPTDPNTIYGRALDRMRDARIDDDVRAVFWYQGESDTGQAAPWAADFDQLRIDWLLDYPLLERVFAFQIREGCGPLNGGVREVQRQLPSLYPNVEVMSTSALPGHNGCHFDFAGYDRLGLDVSRQVLRDLYASGVTANVDPPQLVSASWVGTGNAVVRLTFENPTDTLVWQPGTESFVFFDDLAVRPIAAQVIGNRIDLTLNVAGSQVSEIYYVGHAFDGPALVNGNGVGALTFFGVPIL